MSSSFVYLPLYLFCHSFQRLGDNLLLNSLQTSFCLYNLFNSVFKSDFILILFLYILLL